MEGKNLRMSKGTHNPSRLGEGSVYFIPQDDVPEGLVSGEEVKIVLDGVVNLDEQGLIINVNSIYAVKNKRTDALQDSIEAGLVEESIGNAVKK